MSNSLTGVLVPTSNPMQNWTVIELMAYMQGQYEQYTGHAASPFHRAAEYLYLKVRG